LIKEKDGVEYAVLPVAAEMTRGSDRKKKRDYEISAVKRWLDNHVEGYKWLNPTLPDDDLYAYHAFCAKVLEKGYSFIFTCKESSHHGLSNHNSAGNCGLKQRLNGLKWP
jgi:hypothetical protein